MQVISLNSVSRSISCTAFYNRHAPVTHTRHTLVKILYPQILLKSVSKRNTAVSLKKTAKIRIGYGVIRIMWHVWSIRDVTGNWRHAAPRSPADRGDEAVCLSTPTPTIGPLLSAQSLNSRSTSPKNWRINKWFRVVNQRVWRLHDDQNLLRRVSTWSQKTRRRIIGRYASGTCVYC